MLAMPSRAVLSCVDCGVSTAEAEHGWRAYRADDSLHEPGVLVLCPSCCERLRGEDEERAVPGS
jgi:hypothetical protein